MTELARIPHIATTKARSGELSQTSDTDQRLMDIERYIKIYYSIFLVFLGTVFNILSVLVLQRATFRKTTTSVYLRFLALVDLFVLYNGLSRHMVSGVWGYNIRSVSEGFCKFHQWTSSFAPDTSAWILVAVTTERVMSMVWPHKVKVMCRKTTAWVAVILISVSIMACNLPFLIVYGDKEVKNEISNSTSYLRCVVMRPEYNTFMSTIWHWLDLTKFVLLPCTLLILLNALIICLVIRSRHRIQTANLKNAESNGNRAHAFERKQCKSTVRFESDKTISKYNSSNRFAISKKELSLTMTLVAVNVTFLICNLPIMVYLVGTSYWIPSEPSRVKNLVLTVVTMAMYTNNSVNFLLYCATGSKFRREVRIVLKPLFNHETCVNR